MKVKVSSTSTGCLDYYNQNIDIDIIRLRILDEGKEYIDGLTITAEQFYDKLRENPDWVPQTSQPSLGESVDYFTSLAKEGYDLVFVTTISSNLSGTYNGLKQAASLVEDQIKVVLYDTKTVCFNEGKFAVVARELFDQGKTLEEVLNILDQLKENNTIFFAVDSLTQLVNNGRLTGAKAFFGKLLKIKPILQVNSDGKIVSIEKMRNFKKAQMLIVNFVKNYVENDEYEAYILYAGNPGLKEDFIKVLKDELNLENLIEIPSTPVVGAHIGPDVVGVGVFKKY